MSTETITWIPVTERLPAAHYRTGQCIRDVIARAAEIELTMTAHRSGQMREAA